MYHFKQERVTIGDADNSSEEYEFVARKSTLLSLRIAIYREFLGRVDITCPYISWAVYVDKVTSAPTAMKL